MSKISKPIYGPPQIDETVMTEEEIARAKRKETLHKIRERRIKKSLRTLRLRPLKNFLFWFFGVLSSIGIILGSIFVGVKVVPVGTYTKWAGVDTSEYVSDKIANKSVLDAVLDFDEYVFSDIPAIEKMVQAVLAETGIDDFVVVDYSALKDVKFLNADNGSDLIDEVSKCIKLNGSIKQFENIKAFHEYQQTDCPFEYDKESGWKVKDGVNANLYSYAVIPATGGAPANVVHTATTSTITYNDVVTNGEIVTALKDKTEAQMKQIVFYYKPLTALPLLDIVNDVNVILSRVEIVDIISLFGDNGQVDPLISKLFGGKSIGNLISDIDVDSMLENLAISDIGNVQDLFGQLADLSIFSEWQVVIEDDKPTLVDGKIAVKEGSDNQLTHNPKLYYYLVEGEHGTDTAVYASAFSVDGVLVLKYYKDTDGKIYDNTAKTVDEEQLIHTVDYKNDTLYYANLSEISFGSVLDVIGDSIGTLQMTDLLSTFISNLDQEDMIYKVLEDLSINDLGDNFDADSIMKKITIDTLGGASKFGDLGELSVFSKWDIVTTLPKVEKVDDEMVLTDGTNPKLYYYLASGEHGTDSAEYERAFDDDGKRVEQVQDDTQLYYANLSVVPMNDMTSLLGDSIGRLEIVDVLKTFGADTLSKGDLMYDVLVGTTISDLGDNFNGDTIMDKITIDTLGGAEALGDLGKLSVFNGWEKTETADKPDLVEGVIPFKEGSTTEFTHNPKLYYYLASGEHGTETAEYERAFDDDGKRVEQVNDDTQLYYANLSVVAMNDMTDLLGESIGRLKITELLETFGASFDDDSTVSNILGDKTVDEVGDIKPETIKLTTVLKYDENTEVYKILLEATGRNIAGKSDEQVKALAEDMCLSDFSDKTFDIENISLTTVLDPPTTEKPDQNKQLYDILLSAVTLTDKNLDGVIDAYDIKVGNLNNFEPKKIKISTVLPELDDNGTPDDASDDIDNSELYNILRDVTGETDNGNITIGSLSGFKTDKIKLVTVLPYSSKNSTLYDLLLDACAGIEDQNEDGVVDYQDILLDNLNNFETDNIKLSLVLPTIDDNGTPDDTSDDVKKNEVLYNILLGALVDEEGNPLYTKVEDIKVGGLSSFKTDGIKLTTVLEQTSENEKLYNVLKDVTGESDIDKITVGSLSDFDTDKILLDTVLPMGDNQNLYNILLTALTDEKGDKFTSAKNIRVGDLSSFNTKSIILDTIIGDSANDTVKNIMSQATKKDFGSITVADLGSNFKIDQVKLVTVLGDKSDYGNNILNVLMSKDDDINPITVGNIGERLSNLYISDVYPTDCFVTTKAYVGQIAYYKDTIDGKVCYVNETIASSTQKATTPYYISNENAHIWLFLYYETDSNNDTTINQSDRDINGNALIYRELHHKLSDLQDDVDNISDRVMGATLLQLSDAGLLSKPDKQDLAKWSMNELIDAIDDKWDDISSLISGSGS